MLASMWPCGDPILIFISLLHHLILYCFVYVTQRHHCICWLGDNENRLLPISPRVNMWGKGGKNTEPCDPVYCAQCIDLVYCCAVQGGALLWGGTAHLAADRVPRPGRDRRRTSRVRCSGSQLIRQHVDMECRRPTWRSLCRN